MSQLTSDQRRLLPTVFMATLTSIMGNSLLAPAIPDILDHFDQPDSSAGLLIAATSLPGVIVAPIIGILADRLGRRNVLVPCLAVFGVAGLFAATAQTWEVMLAARFAMGFGAAGLVNLAVVLISDHFSGDDRTHWIGINSGVLTMALALFPLLAGLITAVAGWRWALAPYGLGVVAAAVTWFTLDSARPREVLPIRQQLGGVGAALRTPTISTTLVAGGLSFAIIFGVFLAAMPGHLDNEFGLSAAWRGVVIGLPAATSSISAFNLGRLRRRFAAPALLTATAATWIVAFFLIGAAPMLPMLVAGTLLYGLGEGAMIPALQDTALRDAPEQHRASVMAVWTASVRLGQTIGPLAAGLLIASTSTTWALLSGMVGAAVLLVLFAFGPIRTQRA